MRGDARVGAPAGENVGDHDPERYACSELIAKSVVEDPVEVLPFPQAGAVVVLEGALLLEELGGVELAAPADDGDVVHLVKHLLIDDPLEEERWDEAPIQGGVDADQSLFHRVRAHLDRAAPAAAARDGAPGDAGPDLIFEIVLVQAIEDLLQIEEFALRADGEQRTAAPRRA